MNNIAIIITTFLRDDILFETVNSILDNWNNDYYIIVGDQGETTKEKSNFFQRNFGSNIGTYYKLNYDIGLSKARNLLVDKAKEKGFRYCWISADSIKFTDKYDINTALGWFREYKDRGILGFNLKDRVPWEGKLELIPNNHFLLDISEDYYDSDIPIQKVDICRNFFLARTDCLTDVRWDEDLKLSEHESFFYELKKTDWKVGYTDYITAKYIGYKKGKYGTMRSRISKYRKIVQEKYGIKRWIKYSEAMRKKFQNWRKIN